MAEIVPSVVSETNITSLNETLYAQQQLLQQLYNELDKEREASATAASEALSMIVRLQEEKASLKMEASQYKRMAEEKICHVEESLAVFEDIIYQRESEIASLEFLVQAYRYRLLSMGCNDLGMFENKFHENLVMETNEMGFADNMWRLNPMNSPNQFPRKDTNKSGSIERRRSATPPPTFDSISSNMEVCTIQEIKGLGSSSNIEVKSYWERIRKMVVTVKAIPNSRESVRNKSTTQKASTWSPSFSQASVGLFADIVKPYDAHDLCRAENHKSSPEIETNGANPAFSTIVHDIYEVPQVVEISGKGCSTLIVEKPKRVEKPDSVFADPLQSAIHELEVPKLPSSEFNVSSIHQEFGDVDYHHLIRRIERIEEASASARQEIIAEREEDQLNLLKEIKEQLKEIQSEMGKLEAKETLVPNDSALLDPLQEAMLYFWL